MTAEPATRRKLLSLLSTPVFGLLCPREVVGEDTADSSLQRMDDANIIPQSESSIITFREITKIVAEDGDDGDLFGTVALNDNGTTALIGASMDEDPNGTTGQEDGGAGAAYIFTKNSGEWSQQQKLSANDGDPEDWFGYAVALDDQTALITAKRDENPNGRIAGSAYVFEREDGTWSQQAKLAPDDGDSGDIFGESVALANDGTAAVIGAYGDEDTNGDTTSQSAGSAYIFERNDGEWTQQAKLAAESSDEGELFGSAVDMSDDGIILVGADRGNQPNGTDSGSVHIFEQSGGTWIHQSRLAPDDGDEEDFFGTPLQLSDNGKAAIVGAPGDEDPNGPNAGSAYIFHREGGDWTQQAKLTANDGDETDWFGSSVALFSNGSIGLVGAQGEEEPNGNSAGAVYVFARSNDTWSQQDKLVPDEGDSDDKFGSGIDSAGKIALIGAISDEDPNGESAGSAYLYEQIEATVTSTPTPTSEPTETPGESTATESTVGTASFEEQQGTDMVNNSQQSSNLGGASVFQQFDESNNWREIGGAVTALVATGLYATYHRLSNNDDSNVD